MDTLIVVSILIVMFLVAITYCWRNKPLEQVLEEVESKFPKKVKVTDKGENDPLYSLPLNCMVTVEQHHWFRKYRYINPKTADGEIFKLKEVEYTYYYRSGPYVKFTIEHIDTNTDVMVVDSFEQTNLYENLINYLLGSYNVCPSFEGASRSRSDTEKNIVDFLKALNKLTPTYIEKLKKEKQEKLKQEKWDNLAKTSEANKKTFKDVKAQLEPYKRKTTYKPIELVGYRSNIKDV